MQALLGFIIQPLELALIWLTLLVGNAGVAIILFTVLVRLALAPVLVAQLRHAKAMQRLQPDLLALKRRLSKDPMKLREATSALFRKHKVSPSRGMLIAVIQFPILAGLYFALMHLGMAPAGYPHIVNFLNAVCNGNHIHGWSQWYDACYAVSGMTGDAPHVWRLFHANVLWLKGGLGQPDPLYVLPILSGVTQWIQTRMTLVKTDVPQQAMTQWVSNIAPFILVLFAAHNAAGLSLYWITSALIAIAVQYRITGWGLLPGASHFQRKARQG